MPRVPMIYQQTHPQGGHADASMMGGATGQAMARAGDVLADMGMRMQNRDDSIKKTMAARNHDRALQELTTSLSTEEMADIDTFQKWKENAIAITEETVSNYQGSNRSRAALREQLLNQLYQYEKSVRGAQIKAQHEVIGGEIEKTTNRLSIAAGFAPETIGLTFDTLSAEIDRLAADGAIPVEMAEHYKKSGYAAITASVIQQLEARGELDQAEALLKDPAYGQFLKPDTSRQLTIRISAAKAKQDIEARKREANVQSWAMAMGINPENMTPQQRMLAENASTQTMNYVEKINLATLLNDGKPLSPEVRDRILKTDRAGTRTQVQNLVSQLPAFESGRMSPEERDAFLIDAVKVFPTQYRLDQTTSDWVSIPNSGGIAKLEETIGRSIGVERPPQPVPQAQPIGGTSYGASSDMGMDMDNSFVDAQGRTDYRAPPPQPGERGFVGEGDDILDGVEQQAFNQIMQSGGLWNLADELAGPVAGVRRAISGGPFDIGLGQQEVAAARRTELIQRRLVSALQQNPRYAEGERKDIAVSISIEPEFLSNPTAYRTRLLEIGNYLESEIAYNSNILKQDLSTTTAQMRQQALQAIPLMQKMIEAIQLPPMVKTPQEALKMRPRPLQVRTPFGLYDVPQE